MEKVLHNAKNKGWKTAARDISNKYPHMKNYLLSNRRIDWLFHCLDLSKTDSCLDLGSGWGNITFSLAKYFNEVWSLEAVKERISFQKIRKTQDNINNINFVRKDWLHLPFPDNYFDLVVANGVLEWLGLSDFSRNPREIQLEFLKETRRILKPDGCLYIGIENRFGLQFLLGGKDHSGLPFTSILPHKLADLTVKLFRKTDGQYVEDNRMEREWNNYRSYIYSYWGYKKILNEADFNQMNLYWTLSYNNPKYAGRFDGESFSFLLKSLKKRNILSFRTYGTLAISIASHFPNWLIKFILPIICPDFLIFAYKGKNNNSFESKLLKTESRYTSFIRIGGSHSVNSKVSYFTLKNTKPFSILKFPRFKDGINFVEVEEKKMAQFNQLDIKKRKLDSSVIFMEPPIEGIPPKPYDPVDNKKVLNWLLNFQKRTENGYWKVGELKKKISELNNLLLILPIDEDVQLRTMKRMNLFSQALDEINLPKNAEHGDFYIDNIIIDNDHVFVTDWEFFQENGEPIFDFVFFILNTSTVGNMPNSIIKNFYGVGKYSLILQDLLTEFAKKKGLPIELILQAIPYVILRCIQRISFGDDNRHLKDTNYINLLTIWDEICLSDKLNKF